MESELNFQRLDRGARLSDRMADEILDSIASGRLPTGARLPTERELAEQFGVSRTVVREAVRSLVGKGVIDVKHGIGLTVAVPAASAAQQSMTFYLRDRVQHDYRKVSEVRRMVEVDVAGLAARRATEVELANLRAICDRMAEVVGDLELASVADLDFHRELARATHNELYLVMLDAISDSLIDIRRSTFRRFGRSRVALEAHRGILARVAAHDGAGARAAMREHLDDVEDAWERTVREGEQPVSVESAAASEESIW